MSSHQLRDLLELEDDLGFITVTASFAPSTFDERGPSSPPQVRSELRALVRDADDDIKDRVRDRLAELEPAIEHLLDPRSDGRGRFLAAGLSGGDPIELRIQAPLPTEVRLEDGPAVRSLLEVVDEHGPAAVLLLHRDEALLLHVELGVHEQLRSWAADLGDSVFADEFYGPSHGAPTALRRGLTNREAREDRIQANLDRFLGDVADDTRTIAKEEGLDRIVLVGPSHERSVVADALTPLEGAAIIEVARVATGTSTELLDAVQEALTDHHRGVELDLVRRALDGAASGGTGATGLADVARALSEGKVRHLLLTPWTEAEGFTGQDGVLATSADAEMLVDARPEPRLVHRMIQRALATDARVTPVDGEAAALLTEHEEIAAVLRW